jgi:exonuclease SbcC
MLELQKLEMTNFMCVSHAELDFTDSNVVLLVGENGEGKSTVLEAVAFCLDSDHKKSDTFGDYIKEFEHTCNVKLWATVQNKPIYFDLTIKDKSSTVERIVKYGVEGEEDFKEYKNSEVSTLLEKLGLLYYSDIIMSMQDEGDITKKTPAKRAEYLSRLLNFDFSDKVQILKDRLKEAKDNIEYNTSQVEFNTKSIEDRKKELKEVEVLTFTSNDIILLQSDIQSLNDQLNSLSDEIKRKDQLNNTKNNIVSDISRIEQDILKVEQEITNINNCIQNVEEKKNQIERLTEERKQVFSELEELNKLTIPDEVDEKAITDEVEKLTTENSELNVEYKIATKNIELVNNGICPTCGHEFDEGERQKYEDALNSVTEKLRNSSTLLRQKQDAKKKILEDNKLISLKKLEHSQTLSAKQRDIENFDKQIELLSSTQEVDYTSAIKEKNDLITNKKAEINLKKLELENIEKEISSMSDLGDKQKTISSQITTKQNTLNEYNQKLLRNNMILQNNQKVKDFISETETKIEELKEIIEKHRVQKSNVEEEIQILDKLLPNYLIIKKCKELESEMNKFIQRIFPTMAIYLSQGKKGVDLYFTMEKDKVEVFDKDHLKSIKMASGFQKSVVSIAFKISLCLAYGLRFSFFDEIDQAATEKNSDAVLKMIVTNDIFDQTFIITHKPTVRATIKSVAPNLLTYYVKKGSFSTEEE